ncbi:MAG: hypothetical protein PXZ07_11305 [Candidatus Eremiobacteraeota bacterium]|nr:hypothetical protein [Candidatus Eremiobacteraeota bacterium]
MSEATRSHRGNSIRIVSLLPSATEILYAIGAGAASTNATGTHLVGTPGRERRRYDRSPRSQRNTRRIEPDLIITQELCGVCAAIFESSRSSRARLSRFSIRYERSDRSPDTRARLRARARRALHDPPFAPGHWTPDLLELLGVRSTIAFPHEPARSVSWEEIAGSDPESSPRRCRTRPDCGRRDLRAVRDGRIIVLDGNAYFNRPDVRLVEGTEMLLEARSALEDARYRRA